MASPFADFPNVRLAWQRPTGAPTNLRNGLAAPVETFVIEGFLGGQGGTSANGSTDPAGAPSIVTPGARPAKIYIIRWALLTTGQTWLQIGTGWSWNTTALRPTGLTASDQELQAYLGPMDALPTPAAGTVGTLQIDQVGSAYGDGGIGALLRAEAGDVLYGTLRFPR